MEKKWQLRKKITEDFKNKFPEINPVILQLIFNRGLKNQIDIDEFLNPDYSQDLHDPFLFKDMEKVVARIKKAQEKNEKIVVHGDYDADGVCAAVILYSTLKELGAKNLEVFLPHREKEGYGLNQNTVKELARLKTDLIITCDCGISNHQEVKEAHKLGMEVIVTDHHEPPKDLPPALAIINPHLEKKYPFSSLSGSGVAFKLVQALSKKGLVSESFEKWLLDLVAVATIADCSPLLGENRTLVKYGLTVLRKSRRVGLQALSRVMGTPLNDVDTREVAFQIVPRLNAAGRLDHANAAFKLLMAQSQEEADILAQELNEKNKSRQNLAEELTSKTKHQVSSLDKKILLAQGEGWPLGLIGLVAGKIAEEFHRPTIVLTISKKGIHGSGRSVDGFDITAAITKTQQFFSKFGGHEQACGFTLKEKARLPDFKKAIEMVVEDTLDPKLLAPVLEIEGEMYLGEINWQFFELLEQFCPFGEGNPKPLFLVPSLEITGLQKVGQNENHLRIFVTQDNLSPKKVIGFGFGRWEEKLKIGDKIDLVCVIDANEWNGSRELQLKAMDLRISS